MISFNCVCYFVFFLFFVLRLFAALEANMRIVYQERQHNG